MKEVTQDIATEIKSELREVISKVDNVLESTEPLDSSSSSSFNLSTFQQLNHLTSAEEMKSSDAVSASDVAQYLREFSIEMASEVKSEIREMCATVKDFNEHPRRSSPTDLEGLKLCLKEVMGEAVQRKSESVIATQSQRVGRGSVAGDGVSGVDLKPIRSESFPSRCASSQGWQTSGQSAVGGLSNGNGNDFRVHPVRHTGAISKLSDSSETASRDSGINMCDSDLNQSQSSSSSSSGFTAR